MPLVTALETIFWDWASCDTVSVWPPTCAPDCAVIEATAVLDKVAEAAVKVAASVKAAPPSGAASGWC